MSKLFIVWLCISLICVGTLIAVCRIMSLIDGDILDKSLTKLNKIVGSRKIFMFINALIGVPAFLIIGFLVLLMPFKRLFGNGITYCEAFFIIIDGGKVIYERLTFQAPTLTKRKEKQKSAQEKHDEAYLSNIRKRGDL